MIHIVERLNNLIEAESDPVMYRFYRDCLDEIERWRKAGRAQANVELSEENDHLIDENERLQEQIEALRLQAIADESEVERLRALVKELADDLESELFGHYGILKGGVHPAEQRRFERDMDPVYRARCALEEK